MLTRGDANRLDYFTGAKRFSRQPFFLGGINTVTWSRSQMVASAIARNNLLYKSCSKQVSGVLQIM